MLDSLINAINSSSFSNPFSVAIFLFLNGGWIVALLVMTIGGWWSYMNFIHERFLAKQKYVLLAIDVPRENEQTPKAMENAFAHLFGVKKNPNLIEKYIQGYLQPRFSFEIISISGYIQFLIRAPAGHRDLVESVIYAQYPNAEISEVEDYVDSIPKKYPHPEYNLWGTEFELAKPSAYPLRTYPLFEHALTQTFLDPMASLLEIMGRLREGEQIWLQMLITPNTTGSWRETGLRLIKKMIGAKAVGTGGLLAKPTDFATGVYQTLTASLIAPGAADNKKDREMPSLMQHIPPNERSIIEAIGIKIAKIGWNVKFRYVYSGKKELFDKTRNALVIGALHQFNSLDLNSLKTNKRSKTAVDYFFVNTRENYRRRKMIRRFAKRSGEGAKWFVLNIEELASLYHFPVITVKAPLVQKSEAKRGEPPTSLPLAAMELPDTVVAQNTPIQAPPPSNIPVT